MSISKNSVVVFLSLLRIAVGNGRIDEIKETGNIDWQEVFELSRRMNVSSVVWSGIQQMCRNAPDRKTGLSSPQYMNVRVKWLCTVKKEEDVYAGHESVIRKLGAFYYSHGLGMMLLKGYGLSLNYPVPRYRTSVDIDCFLFYLQDSSNGKQLPAWKYGDISLSREQAVEIHNDEHHHSVFHYEGVMIENHYDFINVHSHRHNRTIESRLKEMAREKGREILPNVFLPPPNLNALFVIRHIAAHFAAAEMTVRQILDWALLIRVSHEEIEWYSFWRDVETMGMMKFVRTVVNIAVKYLGFDSAISHLPVSGTAAFDGELEELTDIVMRDVLFPKYLNPPSNFFKMIKWKNDRWWANRWKHKMVYRDSLLSTFLYQVTAHLLKPKSLVKL